MLMLDGQGASPEAVRLLTEAHRSTSDLLRSVPRPDGASVGQLGLVAAVRKAVDEEWGQYFDGVAWTVDSEFEARARSVPAVVAETLFYATREAVRNAAQHGRGERKDQLLLLRIEARSSDGLNIIVEDNGVGFKPRVRPDRGKGQGLALHSAMLAIAGGTLTVEPNPGGGTRVILSLPCPPREP